METLRLAKFTLNSGRREFNSFEEIDMPNNITIKGAIQRLKIPNDVDVYLV